FLPSPAPPFLAPALPISVPSRPPRLRPRGNTTTICVTDQTRHTLRARPNSTKRGAQLGLTDEDHRHGHVALGRVQRQPDEGDLARPGAREHQAGRNLLLPVADEAHERGGRRRSRRREAEEPADGCGPGAGVAGARRLAGDLADSEGLAAER